MLFAQGVLCESSIPELKHRLRVVWHSIWQTTGLPLSFSQTSPRHSIRRAPAYLGLNLTTCDFVITRGQSKANFDDNLEAIEEIAVAKSQICKSCRLIEIEKERMKNMRWQIESGGSISQLIADNSNMISSQG
jgi:hypothetical protein